GVKVFKDMTVIPWDMLALFFWASVTACITLGCGFWQLLNDPEPAKDADSTRMFVLFLGGLTGFATFLASLMLTVAWWDSLVTWMQPGEVKEPVKGLIILLQIAVLAFMFACLLAVRTEERSNPTLRRLIYGYNAALTGLLLLYILALG